MATFERGPWRAALSSVIAALFWFGCSPGSGSGLAPSAPPAASSASPARPEAATRQIEEADAQRHVSEVLAHVAAVRHLAVRAPVTARVLDRAALIASVREHVKREMPPDVLRNQGEMLVGLGLVPPEFDYEEGAFRLLEAQLAGFYEPHDKRMYLASDLDERAKDATLAHELVHALQDQHYDLARFLSYQADGNDRESAIQALAEGDATSAMMDVMLSSAHRRAIDVPDDLFAAEVEGSMGSTPDVASVPRVLRTSLVAPYVDGVLFVHALRRRGISRGDADGGWQAVDAAWRSPPATTEQLLHLDKFDAREPPETIAPLASPRVGNWESMYDDVFGEEGLRIAIEEWLPRKAAAEAAAGWGGDRVSLFREIGSARSNSTTQFAVAWRVRFDVAPGKARDAEAVQAFRILAAALRPARAPASDSLCVERKGVGPLVLARSGRELVMTAGPYRREGTRVVSDAQCSQIARWAADILSKQKP